MFYERNNYFILELKGHDLGINIANKVFDEARGGSDPPRLPKLKLEKAIKNETNIKILKLSHYLPD